MSRIVVIGATGHVGTYLVPRLVRAGHEVVALSRGAREPYVPAPEWRSVERVAVDREAEDAAGVFGERIAALAADAVVDMICFTPESAQQLVDALRPTRPLLLHCGTIWVHGPAARVPVTEDEPRTAYGEYGTGKAAIEALLHRETVAGGVPSVVLHPGHISGGPWPVITPAGNLDLDVWRRLATGEPLALPDLGLGVLHHVHADDVAQAFERALTRPAAIGSSFHVVSEQAMTLRGLAAGVAGWFGREPVHRARRLGGVRAARRRRARRGEPRARRPQHRREHRPGPRRARIPAAVQLARRPPRVTSLARGERPRRRRRRRRHLRAFRFLISWPRTLLGGVSRSRRPRPAPHLPRGAVRRRGTPGPPDLPRRRERPGARRGSRRAAGRRRAHRRA